MAAGREVSVKTRSELNQQAENLEAEIRQLEERIKTEKEEAAKVEEIIENSGVFLKKYHQFYYPLFVRKCLESQEEGERTRCWMTWRNLS